jgi:recombinational DNA repair protein (RecF pathway)
MDELHNELRQLYSLLHSIQYSIQIATRQLHNTPYKDAHNYTQISQYLNRNNDELKLIQDTITYFELELERYERN